MLLNSLIQREKSIRKWKYTETKSKVKSIASIVPTHNIDRTLGSYSRNVTWFERQKETNERTKNQGNARDVVDGDRMGIRCRGKRFVRRRRWEHTSKRTNHNARARVVVVAFCSRKAKNPQTFVLVKQVRERRTRHQLGRFQPHARFNTLSSHEKRSLSIHFVKNRASERTKEFSNDWKVMLVFICFSVTPDHSRTPFHFFALFTHGETASEIFHRISRRRVESLSPDLMSGMKKVAAVSEWRSKRKENKENEAQVARTHTRSVQASTVRTCGAAAVAMSSW